VALLLGGTRSLNGHHLAHWSWLAGINARPSSRVGVYLPLVFYDEEKVRIPNRPMFAAGAIIFTICILIYREATVSGAAGLCIAVPGFPSSCSTVNPPLYLGVAAIGLLMVVSSFFLFRRSIPPTPPLMSISSAPRAYRGRVASAFGLCGAGRLPSNQEPGVTYQDGLASLVDHFIGERD
jgi:hypothetical protein